MMVPGYERQTLQCSGCGESEHRLIFNPAQSSRARETWERMNLRYRERQAVPHCLACGEEMTLVETVPDNNMMIPGYEHQTHRCAACGFSESRFVFKPPPHGTEPVQECPWTRGLSLPGLASPFQTQPRLYQDKLPRSSLPASTIAC